MNVYVFQAALLCEDCAKQVRARIIAEDGQAPDLNAMDSDIWPQGPYPDGGGEADSPQHCDHCGEFLKNPLTDDGYAYVQAAIEEELGRFAKQATSESLAIWFPYYFTPDSIRVLR